MVVVISNISDQWLLLMSAGISTAIISSKTRKELVVLLTINNERRQVVELCKILVVLATIVLASIDS